MWGFVKKKAYHSKAYTSSLHVDIFKMLFKLNEMLKTGYLSTFFFAPEIADFAKTTE